MPRYNVKFPDGMWRCFSSVVDDFITPPMTFEEYKAWRRGAYSIGDDRPSDEVDRESDSLLTAHPTINVMGYEEAVGIKEICERSESEEGK